MLPHHRELLARRNPTPTLPFQGFPGLQVHRPLSKPFFEGSGGTCPFRCSIIHAIHSLCSTITGLTVNPALQFQTGGYGKGMNPFPQVALSSWISIYQ